MSYDIRCCRCSYTYYTVGSSTWYKSGTVTRYPSSGYCKCCGAGETNPGRSWSGNVVKIECHNCSNLITYIDWSDWNNSSSESAGYCGGCRNEWLNKKQSWENLKSKASSCSWASVSWDGWSGYSSLCNAYFRIKCNAKSHDVYSGSSHSSISSYLSESRCPVCVRYEAAKSKSNFCPDYYTFSAPKWARVNKKIDAANWIWTHCEIYCISKNKHCVYYQDSFDEPKPGSFYHNEITQLLSMNECPKCKKEEDEKKADDDRKKQAAKLASDTQQKTEEFCSESNALVVQLQNLTITNDSDSKLPDSDPENLDIMEQKMNTFMNEAKSKLAALEDTIANANDIVDDVCKFQTIETQKKLQNIMDKITMKQDEILKGKNILRKQCKKTNDELIANSKLRMENEAACIQQKEKENELNNVEKDIESLHKKISLNGKERNSNPAAAQKMDKKYDELLKNLKEKYQLNKEKTDGLKKVGERIQAIRAKLIAHQSKNKYILQCLDNQYNRLQESAQGIAVKYEQRAMYFMTVTCNLSEKVLDKFKEEELDQDMDGILELEKEDLFQMGINNLTIKRILRNIKKYKDSYQ